MSIEVGVDAFIDLTDELKGHNSHHNEQKMHVIYSKTIDPLQVPLVAGAGTLDSPVQMGPVRGFMWSITRFTLSGWSAGTVNLSINGMEPIYPQGILTPNTYFFGKGQFLLGSGDRFIVTATGITGFVQINGKADVFETKTLSHYLGGY
jgi:hypothetical protein